MTTKRKLKRPTRVSIERLESGNIRVVWDAPILIQPMDMMLVGYRKCNKFITDSDGYVVGFELHPREYTDMLAKWLGVKAADVIAVALVKGSNGR